MCTLHGSQLVRGGREATLSVLSTRYTNWFLSTIVRYLGGGGGEGRESVEGEDMQRFYPHLLSCAAAASTLYTFFPPREASGLFFSTWVRNCAAVAVSFHPRGCNLILAAMAQE